MGFMTIDGQRVEFTNEPNVLTVIRNAEIDIPTLCYHSELSIYGACRLCTVEDDRGKTFASCAEPPRDGMVIYTNTPRLMRYRRTILELLLAAHDRDCTTCVKSGECHLLELAHRMGVDRIRFKNREAKYPIDESSPAIVRNPNKCILCGDCVRMCDNVQSVNAIDFAYRGTSTLVTPAFNKTIAQTNCVNCGQCRVVCPTGAISIKTNIDEVWDALADPNTIVVAQVAPAVRVALGDKFGIPKGENVMGKLVNALHRLGFHEVYDTTYGADLTVIEEAEELLERISSGAKGPLFTSCCPGWVSFAKSQYPELLPQLSTTKSPQQMFGAVIKTYFAQKKGIAPENITCVSIMPCMSKKRELTLPGMDSAGTGQDIDYVLTTREICRLIKADHIDVSRLPECDFDDPLGEATGAGVIFGASGGVLEAALRTAYHTVTGENPEIGEQSPLKVLRQIGSFKELEIDIKGVKLHCAALSSLGEARRLIQAMKRGECHYDFVEIMACPGGCINGGGQPLRPSFQNKPKDCADRDHCLRAYDVNSVIRFSHENQAVQTLYAEYLEAPLSDRAHHLLHVEEY